MFPLSCAFLANTRGERLHFERSWTRALIPIVEMMERTFPGVQMRAPFSLGARQAVTATGQKFSVTERTIPLQLALVTPWGPAPLPPISFAVMPGSDGVLLLGLPTLKDWGRSV